MKSLGEASRGVMIIDMQAHMDLEEITPKQYLRAMDESGVHKVVLLASLNSKIPHTPKWKIGIMRFLLVSRLHPIGKRIYESLVSTGNLKGGGLTIQIIHNPDNDHVT